MLYNMMGVVKMTLEINQRKTEHIDLCLKENVEGVNKTTGLEGISFIHNALPEINFSDINLETSFLNKKLKAPFLVSSMTGGSDLAANINHNLAKAAEEKGWAIGLGSTRALLESDSHKESFMIRKSAQTVPLIANLGAVQLNYGYGVKECKQIIEQTGADSLVLHLNSLQEVVQDGGDLNFADLLPKIEKLCREIEQPIGVKEVGFGIDGHVAKQLTDVGIAYVDVAGAGGTSWSQVEKLRSKDPLKKAAAEAFNSWGLPTKDCIVSVNKHVSGLPVIASGGMKTGLDAAKAITIGADMVGFARQLLQAATESVEAVILVMDQIELELKMAMFGIGVKNIEELQNTRRISVMGRSLLDE